MPPLHPNNLFVTEFNGFVLLLLVIWGLATCFLGYPLFRILLATFGLAAGIAGGMALAGALRQTPTGLDYAVACVTLGILIALVAWYVYRIAFAAGVGWLVAAEAATLVGWIIGSPDGTIVWIIGCLLGLAAALVAYGYLQRAIIVVSSLVGAVVTVYAVTLLLFGQSGGEGLIASTFGQGRPWVAWFLALVAVALSAGGMILQSRLVHAVGETFMPKARETRRRSGRGSTEVRPRFTRV